MTAIVVLFHVAVLGTLGGLLLWAGYRRYLLGEGLDAVGSLGVPLCLLLVFGLGGLVLVLLEPGQRNVYGASISTETTIWIPIYYVIASGAHVLGYSATAGGGSVLQGSGRDCDKRYFLSAALGILVALDASSRIGRYVSGTYFAWAEPFAEGAAAPTTVLSQLGDVTFPVVMALSVYLWGKNRSRLALLSFWGVLALEVAAGQRRSIVFVGIVVVGVYVLVLRRWSLRFAISVVAAGVGVLVAVFPIIEDARVEMRQDGVLQGPQRAAAPLTFVTDYVPMVIGRERLVHAHGSASERYLTRLSGNAGYLASIQKRIDQGWAPQGLGSAFGAMWALVPGPSNPVDADADVYRHFNIGRVGLDANGSPLSDSVAHLGVAGPILLFGLGGLLFGVIARVLRPYGDFGTVLLIGAIPLMIPIGDSIITYFGPLRIYVPLIAVLLLVVGREMGESNQLGPGVPDRGANYTIRQGLRSRV